MQGDNKTYAEMRHTNAVKKNQMSTRRAFGASICVECNVCVEEKREPKIKAKRPPPLIVKGMETQSVEKGERLKQTR